MALGSWQSSCFNFLGVYIAYIYIGYACTFFHFHRFDLFTPKAKPIVHVLNLKDMVVALENMVNIPPLFLFLI